MWTVVLFEYSGSGPYRAFARGFYNWNDEFVGRGDTPEAAIADAQSRATSAIVHDFLGGCLTVDPAKVAALRGYT